MLRDLPSMNLCRIINCLALCFFCSCKPQMANTEKSSLQHLKNTSYPPVIASCTGAHMFFSSGKWHGKTGGFTDNGHLSKLLWSIIHGSWSADGLFTVIRIFTNYTLACVSFPTVFSVCNSMQTRNSPCTVESSHRGGSAVLTKCCCIRWSENHHW